MVKIILLSNLCALVSSITLGLSAYQKDKKHMILYQIVDCVFAALSCILLFGYSGAITNLVALVRNVAEYFHIKSNVLTSLIIGALVSVSIFDYSVSHNILVILPAIAFIEYSMVIAESDNYKTCKIALLINEVLWLIYFILLKNYVEILTLTILAITTANAIRHTGDVIVDNGLNKHQRKQLKFEINKAKHKSSVQE